ncbi:hypothetical protein EsDP_00006051 [Epichloe bromicola]|uniref:TeaA receptor TeaR n=1 Tax=Epichloe bromicola TaxID=79588 RepID=A0ABQ0CWP3_9HYPO
MAAVSSAPTGATALTPPSSSHGDDVWDFSGGASEIPMLDKHDANRFEQVPRGPPASQNSNTIPSSYSKPGNRMEMAARKMHSADNLNSAQWGKSTDGGADLSSALAIVPRLVPASSSDWAIHSKHHAADERKRHIQQTLGMEYSEEDSKWIHRDKLAKIENEELQAAGFMVPRARASSKQRRARGQHSIDSDLSRHRNDSAHVDHRNDGTLAIGWDLRTPEEIADEEENAYFTAQSSRGGTRIPVARISPAPIPQDYLERSSPSARRIDSLEGDAVAYTKTRSRSASASTKELDTANSSSRALAAKRSVTDMSPKKTTPRKASAASKSSTATGRPKTRSGPSKDANRPVTRSGEPVAFSHQPEGDPPWVFDSYKPDPRLPPDQQLLPTVAKRLRQEQWRKEGRFGDAYDKEFRPLNDHEFPQPQPQPQPQEPEPVAHEDEDAEQIGEWPLKPGSAKSPKQSSYSTMPKISDRPPVSPMSPITPITSPKTPIPPLTAQSQAAEPTTELGPEMEKQKAGCGCCVMM